MTEKLMKKRESLNPVTISGKKHADTDAPPVQIQLERQLTIGRVDIPAQPKDGQQRLTDKPSADPLITVMMWDGKREGGKVSPVQAMVIEEEKFLNAMCLLFADRLCRAEEVDIAEALGLIKANKPEAFANFMKKLKDI